MKFGAMLRLALEAGFDGVATGHYARMWSEAGRPLPAAARRPRKRINRYVLYSLSQRAAGRARAPAGGAFAKARCARWRGEAGLPGGAEAGKPGHLLCAGRRLCRVPFPLCGGALHARAILSDTEGNVLGRHRRPCALHGGPAQGAGCRSGGRCMSCRSTRRTNRVVVGPEGSQYARRMHGVRRELDSVGHAARRRCAAAPRSATRRARRILHGDAARGRPRPRASLRNPSAP